ncbi:hypothetical protein LJB86_05890, partial [Deltaproteobacteria bacterium OttesenSCG-928-M10]|nr:hypothetical protein [Deltaproteobacteria bacterium OttesenSCG-928-M10]
MGKSNIIQVWVKLVVALTVWLSFFCPGVLWAQNAHEEEIQRISNLIDAKISNTEFDSQEQKNDWTQWRKHVPAGVAAWKSLGLSAVEAELAACRDLMVGSEAHHGQNDDSSASPPPARSSFPARLMVQNNALLQKIFKEIDEKEWATPEAYFCFSNDGKVVFTTQDGYLMAIETATGKQLWSQWTDIPYGDAQLINNNLVSGTFGLNTSEIRIHDPLTGKVLAGPVDGIEVQPNSDGRYLWVNGNFLSGVHLIDLKTNEVFDLKDYDYYENGKLNEARYNQAVNNLLKKGGFTSSALNLETTPKPQLDKKLVDQFHQTIAKDYVRNICGLVRLPDGKVALVSGDGVLLFIDLNKGTVSSKALTRPQQSVLSLAISGDGHVLVAADRAGGLTVLKDEKEFAYFESGIKEPSWLAVAQDGALAWVASENTVAMVDLKSAKIQTTPAEAAIVGLEVDSLKNEAVVLTDSISAAEEYFNENEPRLSFRSWTPGRMRFMELRNINWESPHEGRLFLGYSPISDTLIYQSVQPLHPFR